MDKFIEINIVSGITEVSECKNTHNLTFYSVGFVYACANDFSGKDSETWKVTEAQFNALDANFGIKKLVN